MAYEAILVGSGILYIAPLAEAFPKPDIAPAGNWVSLGEIDGGVEANVEQTVDEHRIDSETGPVKMTRSEESMMLSANLAEATLANLAAILNDNTVSTATTPTRKILGMYRGATVSEHAFLFRGSSPYGAFNAQFEVPRGAITGNIGMSFTKDEKVLFPVEFSCLVDDLASSDDEKFGRWVAQSA